MKSFRAFYQQESFVYLTAIVASIMLSAGINLHTAVINPDAICYLLSAQTVVNGINAAMHLCPQAIWPFYSTLIYAFTELTHFSYTTSAYVINGIFSLISVTTFIAIIKQLGGSRRILWLAAVVILLAHQFNSVRADIIRDHGFWAFYLISLWCFLRYFSTPNWLLAFAGSGSLLLATLFRIEGAIFLLALPIAVWFHTAFSWRQRVAMFFSLNVPIILISISLITWLTIHPHQSVNKLGRLGEIVQQLQHGLMMMIHRYDVTKSAFISHVLTPDSLRDAGLVLFLTLVCWYLVTVVANFSFIYALLAFYAYWTNALYLKRSAKIVLFAYILINFLITAGFFAEHLFLSKRYIIAFSLVLMIWVPFALDKIMFAQTPRRLLAATAAICIGITAIGGIVSFGHSKTYIRNAGDWLAENVPANARIFSNDYQLMYYSKHFGDTIFQHYPPHSIASTIQTKQWKQFNYLALRIDHTDKNSILHKINLTPLQVFANKSGDRVVIFKVGDNK